MTSEWRKSTMTKVALRGAACDTPAPPGALVTPGSARKRGDQGMVRPNTLGGAATVAAAAALLLGSLTAAVPAAAAAAPAPPDCADVSHDAKARPGAAGRHDPNH